MVLCASSVTLRASANSLQPKKTPKVTKINAPKTPNGDASAAKKKTAAKPKKVSAPKAESEEEIEDKKPMTEAEKMQQREKAILYLRHRLQKGFLSRDQAPKEDEMAGMADFFSQLESYESLEASIIRTTKIHKVLKAIVKLNSIPKDEEYNFRKRSHAMLDIWSKALAADGDEKTTAAPADSVAATNGSKEEMGEEAERIEEKIDKEAEPVTEPLGAPVETTDPGNEVHDEADVDVSMATAPEHVEPEAPATTEESEEKPSATEP